MTSAAALLAAAASEIGYAEGRGNRTKFAAEAGHANGAAWCATFTVAIARRVGIRFPSESAYTPTAAAGWKAAGRWHTSNPQPGDVVYFEFPGMGRISHVGFVEKVLGGGRIQCIEGNTNAAGSRTGGSVLRKVRSTSMVRGYGRPDYAGAGPAPVGTPILRLGSKGPAVEALQKRLVERGHRIAVDGDFGPATDHAVRRVQAKYGLAQDGVVGPKTWAALLLAP